MDMRPSASIELRRSRYQRLSSRIAHVDDAALRSLLGDEAPPRGWGSHRTIELDGEKVFIKRLPVTDLEVENMSSTRNLYDLPTHYHYGVGSAGFGAFRELTAHIKTTCWVLDRAVEGFPLLYHHRLMPSWGTRPELDMAQHNRYVEYWGGSASIGRFMLDRAGARHELVLFLEHFPHTLAPWLVEHSGETPRMLEGLRATLGFLGRNGILHFDAHFWNVVTDGERPYLTDFGLVLDRGFALDEEERAFSARHPLYDYGEVLAGLGSVAHDAYRALPEADRRRLTERYGIEPGLGYWDLVSVLLDNIERVQAEGAIGLDRGFVDSALRHRGVIGLMDGFFGEMRRNDRKDTPFPHAELERLLRGAGFLPSADCQG